MANKNFGPPTFFPFEEELKKNSELYESNFKTLREWCAKQMHLPKISDNELALFFYSKNYLVEPTKIAIDTFYTIRTHLPEFFANKDPYSKELRKVLNTFCMIPLPVKSRNGHSVIVFRALNVDVPNFVFDDCAKFIFMWLELWIREQGATSGHEIVFDVTGLSLGHVARLTPLAAKKFIFYVQEALPVKLKGYHFVNINSVMDVIMNMTKSFVRKELQDVLHLHSTVESLDKFVPMEYLPNEMGGKAGPLVDFHKAQIKKFESYRDWFLDDEARSRVDESKRIGKPKSISDFVGPDESIKKLNID